MNRQTERARGLGQVWVLCGVAAVTALAAVRAEAVFYDFTKIADSSGTFDRFYEPSINMGGTVGFQVDYDVSGDGVYKGDGSVLTRIVDTAMAGGYTNLLASPINAGGTMAFKAKQSGVNGIYKSSGGAITKLIDPSTFPVANISQVYGQPSINDQEHVTFQVTIPGGQGIYATMPLALVVMVDTVHFPFAGFGTGRSSINNNGIMAFAGTTANRGIYEKAALVSSFVKVVDDSGPYKFIDTDFDINDSSTVAFRAGQASGVDGIYTGNGGAISTVADTTGPFNNLWDSRSQGPSINNAGTTVFWGGLPGGGQGLYTGPSATSDKVIATGDALFGSVVTDLILGNDSINTGGQIAFAATLADGRKVVARADPWTATVATAVLPDSGSGSVTDPYNFLFNCPTCVKQIHAQGLGNAVPMFLELPGGEAARWEVQGDLFQSVLIPELPPGGGGQTTALLMLDPLPGNTDQLPTLAVVTPGTPFDLTQLQPGGVSSFTLSGIGDWPELVVGLTVAGGEQATTISAITFVPEPTAAGLFVAAIGVGAARSRGRRRRRSA